MERRLQERCAELQREVFRLQGAHNTDGYKSLEKHPVALPRQVLPRTNNKQTGSSEHEDEGISSSETGQSLSPEPILILPQNATKKYGLMNNSNNNNEYNGNSKNSSQNHNSNNNSSNTDPAAAKDDDVNTPTIEEVIEELERVVHDAEQDMQQDLKSNRSKSSAENLVISAYHLKSSHLHSSNGSMNNITCNSSKATNNKNRNNPYYQEKDIVPVNLLPQPPKKSRSLSHLLAGGSDFDESDYGVNMVNNETRISYYDDIDMEIEHSRYRNSQSNVIANGADGVGGGDAGGQNGVGCIGGDPNPDLINQTSTNRDLLNVIMDARDKDENIFMTAPGHYGQMVQSTAHDAQSLMPKTAPQKFNGVFFMTEMSTPAKYPKPDITAALEARRVSNFSKSIERLESYGSSGLDSMIDVIMTSERKQEMKNAIAKAPNNFAALRDMALNSTFSMRTKSPTSDIGGGGGGSIGAGGAHPSSMVVYTAGIKTTRMAYACNGSKLSDLPSGLY